MSEIAAVYYPTVMYVHSLGAVKQNIFYITLSRAPKTRTAANVRYAVQRTFRLV
jgi:hypothetical protein